MSATQNEMLNSAHARTHSLTGHAGLLDPNAIWKKAEKNTKLGAATKTDTELTFRTYQHIGCNDIIKFVVSVVAMLCGKLIRNCNRKIIVCCCHTLSTAI